MNVELHYFEVNLNELLQTPVRERGHNAVWIRIQIIQSVISNNLRELASSMSIAAFMLLFPARGLLYRRKNAAKLFYWTTSLCDSVLTTKQFITYLLTPWSRVLLEKLTSKLCS